MLGKYLTYDPFECEKRFYCFVGDSSSDPSGAQDDENIEAAERAREFNFGAVAPPTGDGEGEGPARPVVVSQQAIRDLRAADDEDTRQTPKATDTSFFRDISDAADDFDVRQQVDRQIAMGANYTPPETTGILGAAFANRPQNLVNSLQAGAAQFMGERFNNALMDPNNRAVVDPLSGRVIGVETNRGTLVEGRGLGNNVPSGDGENNAMMSRTMMASGGGGDMDSPGSTTPEQIDDLAINYLQSPFYAYSGFGNNFNPYGFAQGTLVDLLQTRGMTQPNEADTLGLFANPQDFS